MSAIDPVVVEVSAANPDLEAYVSPRSIWQGEAAKLQWKAERAERVVLNPGHRVLPSLAGETVLTPQETTTYYVTAEAEGGPDKVVEIPVHVQKKPEVTGTMPGISYEEVFKSLAQPIFFSKGEPREGRPIIIPSSEEERLKPFIRFLTASPETHVAFAAYAHEYWDGRRGSYPRQMMLLRNRWTAVRNYLVSAGVKPQQIVEDVADLRSVSAADLRTISDEALARRVEFRFAGATPAIQVRIEPPSIKPGESAYMIWSSANADDVIVTGQSPSGAQTEQYLGKSGIIRLDGSITSFNVTARNRYNLNSHSQATLTVEQSDPAPSFAPPNPVSEVSDHATPVLFNHQSAEVRGISATNLNELANWLMEPAHQKYRLTVQGFRARNEATTIVKKRAEAVFQFLSASGIDRSRLRIVASATPDGLEPQIWQSFERRVEINFDPYAPKPPVSREGARKKITRTQPKRKPAGQK